MTNTVLVVAAHPDDELLGLAGTLAKHVDAGDSVFTVIVAQGATSRGDGEHVVSALKRAAAAAGACVGLRPPTFLDLPDNRLDGEVLLDIVQRLEAELTRLQPHVVYTHHYGDLNIDHQIVCRAVLTACRPYPGQSVRAIYAFETPSSTDWMVAGVESAFAPRRFVDIADSVSRKLDALRMYDQEMRPYPHARSLEAVEALARVRGASVGMEYAEAFDVLRQLAD